MRLVCVHSYQTADMCGRPAFTLRSHGFLCGGHYRQQQDSIPAGPRRPQPKWRGLAPQTDDQIIADIIATEERALREGRIVIKQRGALEPVFLRTLEPPTVH